MQILLGPYPTLLILNKAFTSYLVDILLRTEKTYSRSPAFTNPDLSATRTRNCLTMLSHIHSMVNSPAQSINVGDAPGACMAWQQHCVLSSLPYFLHDTMYKLADACNDGTSPSSHPHHLKRYWPLVWPRLRCRGEDDDFSRWRNI